MTTTIVSNNVFAYATRNKLRFMSTRGGLTAEQLWDVPLRSQDDFNLNTLAKGASKAWKDATEESFVEAVRTEAHVKLEVTLDVIKHVIAVKLAEEEEATKRAANKLEKEKLLRILAEKQDGKLSALSESELKKRIAALT